MAPCVGKFNVCCACGYRSLPPVTTPMVMTGCERATGFKQLSEATRETSFEFRTLKGNQGTAGRSQ
eukprot:9113430-Lingulodinium_polyedra.AAC.1